jgi:hypothetical protein
MTILHKKFLTLGTVAVISIAISACNGGSSVTGTAVTETDIDVTEASLITAASKFNGGQVDKDGTDFDFPLTVLDDGTMTMSIPAGPAPEFGARRTLSDGAGTKIGFGDPVILNYDMFQWSTGELVESSAQYAESYTVLAGKSDDFPIPEYLSRSLLGRSLGDKIQVILPAGTNDLPEYLDSEDAYVVIVELM